MRTIVFVVAACFVMSPVAAATGGHGKNGHSKPTYSKPKPPSNNPSPPPVLPPLVGHDCVYTGAGKDGQPGNDDCAPITPPVTTTSPPPAVTVTPPARVVVVPPVVKTVVKTRTVVKYRTRTVYRTKVVFVVCPKGTVAAKNRRSCVQTGEKLTG